MEGSMRAGTFAIVTAIVCASACGKDEFASQAQPAPAAACTRISCAPGLRVKVEGIPPESYTVHVKAGGRLLRTFQCTPQVECTTFIENETPTEVWLNVLWGDHDREWKITPTYRDAEPNNTACAPTCRQGTVAVVL
jgi:hypothetical protein